jgi:hypothetical protein
MAPTAASASAEPTAWGIDSGPVEASDEPVVKVIAVLLVAALAFGGWELGHRAGHAVGGAVSTLAISIPDQAALTVAEDNLTQAAISATAYQAVSGSFVGLTLPAATVRTATATSYCLESTVREVTAHLSGPNGTPAAGPCP